MRPLKVLFVMEGGGAFYQDLVRGAIYRDLFTARGIVAHYVGHKIPPPSWLSSPDGRIAKQLSNTLIFRILWRLIQETRLKINNNRIVRESVKYDAIVFIKVSSLDLIQKIRQHSRARLVYDHCDALWLPQHAKTYGNIRDILKIVDAVTWDYKYTYDFVKQFNKNVFPWPAASQVELFDRNRRKGDEKEGKIIIGWVGSAGTIYNLYVAWEALERVFARHDNVYLRLLGTGTDGSLLPNFEKVRYSAVPSYSQQQMIDEVLNMDIGLFPMFDVEDSKVRGYLKALVYMSGKAAVIASPRGQVPKLIHDGVNGLLADSTAEWEEKLELLICDPSLRRRIAAAGLETVRRDFSLEKSFEGLLHALGLQQNSHAA